MLCVVIERYIPELLGQFPAYPTNIVARRKKSGEARNS